MAIDRRIGTKLPSNVDRDSSAALRFDAGPYIGVVKRVIDGTRSGRLQVWIPDLGGSETDERNWRTVSYASPFGGTTFVNPNVKNTQSTFSATPQSYGFWMVPPDLDNQVLCTFVGGDPGRGYWFACITPELSHYMTPAVGSSTDIAVESVPPEVSAQVKPGNRYPVGEFNLNNSANYNPTFYRNAKPLHLAQFKVLLQQGLQDDAIRGSIGSSSQRETPSAVFGFSTPGRPLPDPATNPNFLQSLISGTQPVGDLAVTTRAGGHSLVMDDGSLDGKDQLVRIKTAKGHQILMHDTEGIMYISNSAGTAWVELSNDGQVKVYGRSDISIRSQGSLNLHADADVLINAGRNFAVSSRSATVESPLIQLNAKQALIQYGQQVSLASGSTMALQASGAMGVKAGGTIGINGGSIALQGGGASVNARQPTALPRYTLSETRFTGTEWAVQPNALSTIVRVAPTHEPYPRDQAALIAQAAGNTDANGNEVQAPDPGVAAGPANASGQGVTRAAPTSEFNKQPDPSGGMGVLDQNEFKAYLAQTGYSESNGKYDAVNQFNYLGKYQLGAAALIDQGLVKPGTTNAGLDDPNNWVGGPGKPASKDDFLGSPAIQERAMEQYTQRNYNSLVNKGIISNDTPPDQAAGYLSVAHLLGAGGAAKWYNGQGGADANGTTGDQYYNRGRYSQTVLASSGTSTTIAGTTNSGTRTG